MEISLNYPCYFSYLEHHILYVSGLFASAKLQTRWCVIHNGNFYYYVRNDDKKQCGCFKLAGKLLQMEIEQYK